jgi:hypothetical protein
LPGRRVFQVGNICALCEETYPSSALYKCRICGMIYCGNCIITENSSVMCLRCAVKRVSPKAPKSKYANLSIMLSKRARFCGEIKLSFAEIEGIIGDKLPKSAYEDKGWWSNIRGRSHSEAWLNVGWRVKEVNLEEKTVTFIRETQTADNTNAQRKTRDKKIKSSEFKLLALKTRSQILGKRKISKTKLAILQARLKNIERARRLRRRSKLRKNLEDTLK